jgi:TRAP-type C4-dicarboxylate transport system permease small subunit
MGLRGLTQAFDRTSQTFAVAGGWALLGLSVLVGIDVIGRKLFNISVQGSDEIGGYVMAATCAFGFSYTLKERSHIRLNILLPRMPMTLRVVGNLFAYTLFTAFAYMMFWRATAVLRETILFKAVAPTPLETPLVIPQAVWSAGLLWFSLVLTIYLFEMITLVLGKKSPELITRFGVESLEGETSHTIEDSKGIG